MLQFVVEGEKVLSIQLVLVHLVSLCQKYGKIFENVKEVRELNQNFPYCWKTASTEIQYHGQLTALHPLCREFIQFPLK